MEELGQHIKFEIASKEEVQTTVPTQGTVIGYIVQTNVTDHGVSLSWYDSGVTSNIVIGIIPTKYTTNKLQPTWNGIIQNGIHRVYAVKKLKVD